MDTCTQLILDPKEQQNNDIPTIHFTKQNLDPSTSYWVSTCKAVREAMEKYGYFIAIYDQVESELRNAVFALLKDLFDLPTETKSLNTSDIPYFGYIGRFPGDRLNQLYESLGFGDSTTIEAVQSFANLMWPSGNDHFCETIHSYTTQVSKLDQLVTRMLFESYGVEKYCDSHIGSTSYLLRTNGYRVAQDINEKSFLGAMSHTDASLITILQQNEVQGLEVQSKDGSWISVDFPSSSFVVVAGDALLAWSNGRIIPCIHRVTITGKESRYSTGLFSYHNGIVQVPEELADDKYPLRFKPFDHLGYYPSHVKNFEVSAEERVKAYCGIKDAIV